MQMHSQGDLKSVRALCLPISAQRVGTIHTKACMGPWQYLGGYGLQVEAQASTQTGDEKCMLPGKKTVLWCLTTVDGNGSSSAAWTSHLSNHSK